MATMKDKQVRRSTVASILDAFKIFCAYTDYCGMQYQNTVFNIILLCRTLRAHKCLECHSHSDKNLLLFESMHVDLSQQHGAVFVTKFLLFICLIGYLHRGIGAAVRPKLSTYRILRDPTTRF